MYELALYIVERDSMNLLYIVVGLITLALLGYLVVALLKPEWFS